MERSRALVAPTAPRLPTPEAAVEALRAAGRRASAARRLVLEALFAADGPMSADQIADGIGGRVPRSDLTSVYRNLETLEEVGLVSHVHLGHGPGLYALNLDGEREWLTCERCGDFQAVAPAQLDGVRDAIQQTFGYRASFAHFPVVGLCASCQSALGAGIDT
jgi:Fur family transcriptional regulator, ferric uptake regulator